MRSNIDLFVRKQPCKMSKEFGTGVVYSIVENKEDLVKLMNLYCTNMDEVFDSFGQFLSADIIKRFYDDENFDIGEPKDMFEIYQGVNGVELSSESFPQYYVRPSELEFDLDFSCGPYVFITCLEEGFDRFGNISFSLIDYCRLEDLTKNKLVI